MHKKSLLFVIFLKYSSSKLTGPVIWGLKWVVFHGSGLCQREMTYIMSKRTKRRKRRGQFLMIHFKKIDPVTLGPPTMSHLSKVPPCPNNATLEMKPLTMDHPWRTFSM